MMTRRKRLTLVALILLAFLLLLFWLLMFLFSADEVQKVEEVQVVQQVEEVEEVIPVRSTISDKELASERETRTVSADVVSLSKTFVTRYGSFSNEANFANLEDVLTLMSESLAASTQSLIDSSEPLDYYYGVTTSVITVKVSSQTDVAAQVTVTTQREEAIDSPQNISVKYQDIVLTYVKEGGVWKVDSSVWQ
jgi:hypothetical protein